MQQRPRVTSLARRPGFLLSQLGFLSAERFAERLTDLGLHPRHVGLLVHLATADGATQQQVANALGIHRNVMVGLLDDLEQRGLVERRRHPTDRRAHALHLTVQAVQLLPVIERLSDENDDALCAGLEEAERRTLIALLGRLARAAGLDPGVHPKLQRPAPGAMSRQPGAIRRG